MTEPEQPETPMPIRVRDERGRETMSEPLSWRIIEPHRRQAMRNHGQTLKRLRERGGLSPCEAVAILEDRKWSRMSQPDALHQLDALVKAALSRLE